MGRRQRNIQPDADNYNNRNNNINPGYNTGNNNQFDMNGLGQMLNNVDLNQVMGQLSQMVGGPQVPPLQNQAQPGRSAVRDPRLELLQAMKPFLSARRSELLDRVGQFYVITRILNQNKKKK